jgi:hypothetical protein
MAEVLVAATNSTLSMCSSDTGSWLGMWLANSKRPSAAEPGLLLGLGLLLLLGLLLAMRTSHTRTPQSWCHGMLLLPRGSQATASSLPHGTLHCLN